MDARDEGVLIRPAVAVSVAIYTAERRAEFLLANAVDEEDCARAPEEVRNLGLDPESIPHAKPGKDRTMEIVFLDANVLFSAAYRPDPGLRRLWRLSGVKLITSVDAVEDALRNPGR